MSRRAVSCMLAAIAFLSLSGSSEARSKETGVRLAHMQKTYETELARISKVSRGKLQALQQRYLRSLGAMQKAMQKAGRLEPTLVVRSERERFASARSVDKDDLKPEVPELHELQKEYMASLEHLGASRARQILDLAGKYGSSLDIYQKRLTKAGDFESALAVKKAREELDKREELTAARFALADAQTKAPVQPVKPELGGSKVTPADLPARRNVKRENHKRRIRNRYEGFCEALEGDDLDAVMDYLDPEHVSKAGTAILKLHLAGPSLMLKGAMAAGIKIEAGDIDVDEESGTAVSIPRIIVGKEIKKGDPAYWVLVEEEWYVDLRGGKKVEGK